MKIRIAYCAILASGLLLGCKKELQPQESSTDSTAVAAAAQTPQSPAAPTTTTTQPTPAPAPQQAVVPPPAKTAPGMNPPHGQPGHRCDIAVGAPLSSAPAKPASNTPQIIKPAPTTTTTQPTPTNQAPAILNAPTQATAPGMNPPHGQPGHRCDIAVGQPLPKA